MGTALGYSADGSVEESTPNCMEEIPSVGAPPPPGYKNNESTAAG